MMVLPRILHAGESTNFPRGNFQEVGLCFSNNLGNNLDVRNIRLIFLQKMYPHSSSFDRKFDMPNVRVYSYCFSCAMIHVPFTTLSSSLQSDELTVTGLSRRVIRIMHKEHPAALCSDGRMPASQGGRNVASQHCSMALLMRAPSPPEC